MEQKKPDEGETNVIDLASRRAQPPEHAEPLLTDVERREIRALLEYMRTARPLLEAATSRCTILRRLTEEGV
jgi:hypothetical protein